MLPLRARPAPASGVACAGMGAVMTPRMLNRATRARQRLLARQPADVRGVVTDLVGLQAQNPLDPYIALAARVEGFTTDSLAAQVSDLGMVRLPLLRSTIHLVTDVDALALRPVLQDVLRRTFGSTSFAKDTATLDRDAVLAVGRTLRLPLGADADPTDLVRRYLGAFEPAAVAERGRGLGCPGWRRWSTGCAPSCARSGPSTAASCSTCPTPPAPTRRPRPHRGCCPSTTTSCSVTPTGPASSHRGPGWRGGSVTCWSTACTRGTGVGSGLAGRWTSRSVPAGC